RRVRTLSTPKQSSQNAANATTSCAAHAHARCKPRTNANTRNAQSKPNAIQHLHCGRAKPNLLWRCNPCKTARSKALQQQLTAYKQRHNAKDVRLSKSGKPQTEDELKTQLPTVMAQYGKFVISQPRHRHQ